MTRSNGDIKSVQTYDKYGRLDTRYDLKDSKGMEEHRHNRTYKLGALGQVSGHLPLDEIPPP